MAKKSTSRRTRTAKEEGKIRQIIAEKMGYANADTTENNQKETIQETDGEE